MIIETKRLYLREMTEADFPALYDVLGDSDNMVHYSYTFDEKRVRNWITKNIERYNTLGFGLWAVVLKETGQMIGDCGLSMQVINGSIKPEIGYHIHRKFQRQGYAKEAAQKCRDWAFENTPFQMIYSYMKESNVASYTTVISNGMKKIEEYKDTEQDKIIVYGISRKEWDHLKKI